MLHASADRRTRTGVTRGVPREARVIIMNEPGSGLRIVQYDPPEGSPVSGSGPDWPSLSMEAVRAHLAKPDDEPE
jgi:hypothetical protein